MTANDNRPATRPPLGTLTLRSGHLIGRTARDRDGKPIGRVVDLQIEPDTGKPPRVLAVVVTAGPWGRLLGYESPDEKGPWVLSQLSRWLIRRHVRTLPWADIEIDIPTGTRDQSD